MKETTKGPHALDIAMGLNIRARRKDLGISQTALAEAIGLTFQQIQKYERGFNRVSFSKLVEIAHGLDCRVTDLIADLDEGVEHTGFRQDTSPLRVAGGAELLEAYGTAPKPLQRVILKLVVALAKDQQARGVGDDQGDEGEEADAT